MGMEKSEGCLSGKNKFVIIGLTRENENVTTDALFRIYETLNYNLNDVVESV